MNDHAQKISELIHKCDFENLLSILPHITHYPVSPEEIEDDDGQSIIQECDFILENFMPKGEVEKLYKSIFK
jgi:hypothetical protein